MVEKGSSEIDKIAEIKEVFFDAPEDELSQNPQVPVASEETKAKIVKRIKELLEPLCPHCAGDYRSSIITDLVEHFAEIGQIDPKKAIIYNPSLYEKIQLKAYETAIYFIETDMLKNGHTYLWRNDKPKNDWEKGVLGAVRRIQHIVHCILD